MIIVNKIIKTGFSVGWASALDDYGRTVWIVGAHRDGKRFLVRADEKLTAFSEEPCAVVFNRARKVTALDERAALA